MINLKEIFTKFEIILSNNRDLPIDNREIKSRTTIENGKTLCFIWDEKEELNFEKHNIKFETGIKVFEDIDRYISPVYIRNNEERFFIIGKVNNVLFVVASKKTNDWLDTNEELYDIISVRRAKPSEIKLYEKSRGEFIEEYERLISIGKQKELRRKSRNPYEQ